MSHACASTIHGSRVYVRVRARACVPIQVIRENMPRTALAPSGGRRIQTRRSGVHGKGVFAVQDLAEGEVLVEYVGEIVSWQEAQDRHPHDPSQPNHTFYFHIDEDRVIDANYGGNSSRWINHSCAPNCYTDERDGRIFIVALRNIAAGEELSYDYGLIIDEPYTRKLKAEYPCWCGAATCRGTLLAPSAAGARPCPAMRCRPAQSRNRKSLKRQSGPKTAGPSAKAFGQTHPKAEEEIRHILDKGGRMMASSPSTGLRSRCGRPSSRNCRAFPWRSCPASARPIPS